MTPHAIVKPALLVLAVLAPASCVGPRGPAPMAGSGAVVSVRELDVIGDLTVGRGAVEALTGGAAERTIRGPGTEYVVRLDSGGTATIAQEAGPDDRALDVGARVTIENKGENRRVLAAPSV